MIAQRRTTGRRRIVPRKVSAHTIITEWDLGQLCHCADANETSGELLHDKVQIYGKQLLKDDACRTLRFYHCREGGHRIPSVVSWPAVVQGDSGRVSWEMIVTSDFLATIMDVLQVK